MVFIMAMIRSFIFKLIVEYPAEPLSLHIISCSSPSEFTLKPAGNIRQRAYEEDRWSFCPRGRSFMESGRFAGLEACGRLAAMRLVIYQGLGASAW